MAATKPCKTLFVTIMNLGYGQVTVQLNNSIHNGKSYSQPPRPSPTGIEFCDFREIDAPTLAVQISVMLERQQCESVMKDML